MAGFDGEHGAERLFAAFVVQAHAVQLLRGEPPPQREVELPQRAKVRQHTRRRGKRVERFAAPSRSASLLPALRCRSSAAKGSTVMGPAAQRAGSFDYCAGRGNGYSLSLVRGRCLKARMTCARAAS